MDWGEGRVEYVYVRYEWVNCEQEQVKVDRLRKNSRNVS